MYGCGFFFLYVCVCKDHNHDFKQCSKNVFGTGSLYLLTTRVISGVPHMQSPM